MEAGNLYLIRGASTANSPFFETEEDCGTFLQLAERFLKDYMTIGSFQNNRDGWAMIITTKSAREIKRAYYSRRELSTKCDVACAYTEIWKMLSDQVRIFLSTYVKTTNFKSGRKGGKVRCRYERFVFESEEELEYYKAILETAYHEQAQPLKKYRPSKKLHKIRKRFIHSSIYMSSRLLRLAAKVKELGLSCVDLGVLAQDVVRQLIHQTLHHHFAT